MNLLSELLSVKMTYTALAFYVLLAIGLVLYYMFPKKTQWSVLLILSLTFYYCACDGDLKIIMLFVATIVVSFIGGILIDRYKRKWLFVFFSLISIAPLLLSKGNTFVLHNRISCLIVPIGLSFYSLQIYAYLHDVLTEKTSALKNIFKYSLFISFFPQVLQGPIPRYEQLEAGGLFSEHKFDETEFVKGVQLIVWGFFLKYMIADKAAVVVDEIFGNFEMYKGIFCLIVGILYSIQLYADFLACVCISRGVAQIFGITLGENFMQPYRAESIKDFWRRWHISLSNWLRDYVYIPLGGSRCGRVRRYANLFLTFIVSGIWHGNGIRFIVWGAVHGFYQISGDILKPINIRVKSFLGFKEGMTVTKWINRIVTFTLVMFAWIVFRAETLSKGIQMIASIFRVNNIWVLFDDSLLTLGLSWKEWIVLITAMLVVVMVESIQDKGTKVRDIIIRQPLVVRWSCYIIVIAAIIIYGTYGSGYNASDFIYRGF